MDTWQMIRAERASLVDALAQLPDAGWDRPSLCAGWTVRDVVGHMTATADMNPPKLLGKLAASGFDFQRLTRRDIAAHTAGRSNAGAGRRAVGPGRRAHRAARPGPVLAGRDDRAR